MSTLKQTNARIKKLGMSKRDKKCEQEKVKKRERDGEREQVKIYR